MVVKSIYYFYYAITFLNCSCLSAINCSLVRVLVFIYLCFFFICRAIKQLTDNDIMANPQATDIATNATMTYLSFSSFMNVCPDVVWSTRPRRSNCRLTIPMRRDTVEAAVKHKIYKIEKN